MAAVPEGHFELDGFLFGGSGAGPVYVKRYDTGVAEWLSQDADSPTGNRRFFGSDQLMGPTWTFEFNIMRDDTAAGALSALGQLMTSWRARSVRSTPGALSVLRYTRGGRTRRVYGRPRRFEYDPNRTLRNGMLTASAEFVSVDPWHYDDVASTAEIRLLPNNSSGGFVFPAVFPMISTPGTEQFGTVINTGTEDTPLTIQLLGPGTDMGVEFDDKEFTVRSTLAFDQDIVLDGWEGTVRRNDGAELHGSLNRKARLTELMLKPGSTSFRLKGITTSASARAVLTWRNANPQL